MYRSMIVAVAIMGVMKVSIDDIINVIAMGNRFVSTPRAVHMVCIVSAACMLWCACFRIGGIDFEGVLIDMVTMRVMEMAIM